MGAEYLDPALCGLFIRHTQLEVSKISYRGFHHLGVQWDDDFPAPNLSRTFVGPAS
jgi:hypothetical protein